MSSELTDIFERWLSNTRPEHRDLFIQLHELLLSVEPEFDISLKWGNPAYSVRGKTFTYLTDQTNYVHLGFYNGAEFKDPHGLIEGTGKRLRHIKVSALDPEMLAKLKDTVAASLAIESNY